MDGQREGMILLDTLDRGVGSRPLHRLAPSDQTTLNGKVGAMKAGRRRGSTMLKRGLVMAALVAGSLVGVGSGTAWAAEPAPGGGPGFGQHVAQMAQEHAGPDLGECVSAMATGAACPHIHQP